jgi:sugar lactone lactonase YvrE
MKLLTVLSLVVAFLLMAGCSSNNKNDRKDYILKERNLIPEGTAFDNRSGTIYIGSTFKRKIVQIAADGKVTDFIPEKLNGIASIVGMEVDECRGVLWVNTAHANEVLPLMNPHPTLDWMTNICSFDIQTKKLMKRYDLHAEKSFLNDLTVLPNGDVYATESVNNKIYRITAQRDSLELFLSPDGYTFLNGITYSDKFNCLFVSAVEGIIRIDLDGKGSKNYYVVKTPKNIDAGSIDGLTLYKDQLIGHQSTQVTAFYLHASGQEILQSKILNTGPEFDSSTTGEVGGDDYYFIVNSQVRSGIDRVNKTIKPVDSLKDVIIRRIKL